MSPPPDHRTSATTCSLGSLTRKGPFPRLKETKGQCAARAQPPQNKSRRSISPASLFLASRCHLSSISTPSASSGLGIFHIFHQGCFSNFPSGFSHLPTSITHQWGGEVGSGGVGASGNLFKMKIMRRIPPPPPQGPEITVPISPPRIQAPSCLSPAGLQPCFLNTPSPPADKRFELTSPLPTCQPLSRLLLCLECPLPWVHVEAPPAEPRPQTGPPSIRWLVPLLEPSARVPQGPEVDVGLASPPRDQPAS